MVTKTELQKRATDLKKQIEAGKFVGKRLFRMQKNLHMLNFRIRHFENKAIAKSVNEKMKNMVIPDFSKPREMQGQLPGFLEQLNNARIEEMVADKIFKALATKIDEKVDEKVDELFSGGKKHG